MGELQTPSDLTDDQVTPLIADPVRIETHDVALEVIGVLDAEIANIQTQIDAATIEANARPLSPERQAWLRRASYAAAMRRNERHKVYQRDKEIRGTKPANGVKDPMKKEANLLKQQRLLAEAETRRLSKQLALANARAREMELAQERRAFKAHMAMLPEAIATLRAFEYADEMASDHPDIHASAMRVAMDRARKVLSKIGAAETASTDTLSVNRTDREAGDGEDDR